MSNEIVKLPAETLRALATKMQNRPWRMLVVLSNGKPRDFIDLLLAPPSASNPALADRWSNLTRRQMQQRLGQPVSAINVVLRELDLCVRPGSPRGTYQLQRLPPPEPQRKGARGAS